MTAQSSRVSGAITPFPADPGHDAAASPSAAAPPEVRSPPGRPLRGTASPPAYPVAGGLAPTSPREPAGAGSGGEPGTPGMARVPAAVPGAVPSGGDSASADSAVLPGARRWVLVFPAGLELLSLNGREHWSTRNRRTQALKDAAIVMARAAKVPHLDRIELTVIYDPPDRRHRDADNLAATGKACLDGIARVILPGYGRLRLVPGDDSRHVTRVSYEIGPEPYPRGRLRMIITDAGGTA